MPNASAKRKRGLPERTTLKPAKHYVEELSHGARRPIGFRIKLDEISSNPNQPRKLFEGIDELKISIADQGVLEPVLVRPDGRGYSLVAGERRSLPTARAMTSTKTACRMNVSD